MRRFRLLGFVAALTLVAGCLGTNSPTGSNEQPISTTSATNYATATTPTSSQVIPPTQMPVTPETQLVLAWDLPPYHDSIAPGQCRNSTLNLTAHGLNSIPVNVTLQRTVGGSLEGVNATLVPSNLTFDSPSGNRTVEVHLCAGAFATGNGTVRIWAEAQPPVNSSQATEIYEVRPSS